MGPLLTALLLALVATAAAAQTGVEIQPEEAGPATATPSRSGNPRFTSSSTRA